MEGPAPTLDDVLQVLEQFLAGRVHFDLLMATVTRAVAEDPSAAHSLQEKIDAALRSGDLAETVWERLTAEVDRALTEDTPTEWSEDDATAPQSADGVVGAASGPGTGVPPLLDDRVEPAADRGGKAVAAMPPGTLLGDRYVIVSRAHAGGMGDVYKALDRNRKEAGDPNPWVAVKVIGKDFASHPRALAALEREAENCRSLEHENIVRVLGFERDGELCFITMEWLEGESLVELLDRARQKPPNAGQLRRIILGLGAALAHAHSQGVTHADVKPGNVFVTHSGEIKLLDFGAARACDADPDVDARTPAYASCEVLEGQAPVPGDDVFSFALVIYRVLAGKRAFGTSNALEAEAANLAPERVSSLADQAWQALAHALQFRRSNRPPDVVNFLEAFTAPAIAAEQAAPEPAPAVPEPAGASPAESGDVPRMEAPTAVEHAPVETVTVQDTAITDSAPVDPDERLAPRGGWRKPALIAASLAACAGAAWWFWTGVEPAPAPVVSAPRPAFVPPAPVPARDELQPVSVSAQRLDDLSRLDLGAAGEDGQDPTASTEAEALALAATPEDRGNAPQPDAQLASVAAAPAVSPGPRATGETAQLPPAKAEPAPVAKPKAQPKPKAKPQPKPKAEPAPKAEPEPAPQAPARTDPEPEKPPTAGAVADTRAPPKPAATSRLARKTTEPANTGPEPEATPGELAAIGPPTPATPQPLPTDYGPAPAPATAGPPGVAMSELDFSRYSEPRYPRSRTARKTRGWVEVEFEVKPDGTTSNIEVAASEPAELFDESAIAAVKKWKFKPYVVDGEAVTVGTVVRLRFEPQR